jgi:post-GPI attachment to proteins factor 3
MILFALYFTIVRLFHLYPVYLDTTPRSFYAWTLLCLVAYLAHVTYLSVLPRFNYSYNIIANVVLGVLHNILWLSFSLPSSLSLLRRFRGRSKTYRPWYASQAARGVALSTAATFLELFDFPPWWRTVDAHSLWHLATVPLAVLWYDFLINDALDSGWKEIRM